MAKAVFLPVLVLLDHYPAELDNDAGDRFAHVLSHVASACVTDHGATVPAVSLGFLAEQADAFFCTGSPDDPPEVVRGNLVAATAALLAMVRRYDSIFPLPQADAKNDDAQGSLHV